MNAVGRGCETALHIVASILTQTLRGDGGGDMLLELLKYTLSNIPIADYRYCAKLRRCIFKVLPGPTPYSKRRWMTVSVRNT